MLPRTRTTRFRCLTAPFPNCKRPARRRQEGLSGLLERKSAGASRSRMVYYGLAQIAQKQNDKPAEIRYDKLYLQYAPHQHVGIYQRNPATPPIGGPLKPARMRVTHVITRLIIGGAQENTVATVLGLQQRPGMEMRLLAGPTAGPEGSLESAFQPCPQTSFHRPFPGAPGPSPQRPPGPAAADQDFPLDAAGHRPHPQRQGGDSGALGRPSRRRSDHCAYHSRPLFRAVSRRAGQRPFPRRRAVRRPIHHSFRQRGRGHDPPIPGGRPRPARPIYPHLQRISPRTVSGRGK